MKALILILATVSTTACFNTTRVKRDCIIIDNQKACSTEVTIRSIRKYPDGLSFNYNAKTGDFIFNADKVENDTVAFQKLTSDVIKKALEFYKKGKL